MSRVWCEVIFPAAVGLGFCVLIGWGFLNLDSADDWPVWLIYLLPIAALSARALASESQQ